MTSRPLRLGHRGVRGRRYSVRENTIPAFDLCLEYGCDGFEFDVRLTADGQGILCHGPRFAALSVSKNTAARLRRLPLLDDVLARYCSRAFLDIELKVAGLESCLLSAISRNPPQRGFVISSFLPEVLTALRAHSESLPLGIICETRRQLKGWHELPVQYLIAKASLVTPELVGEVHRAANKLFVWTVNRKKSILRLTQWGVDGIISDRPDLLVEKSAS